MSGHPENGKAILAQAAQDWVAAINYYFDALDYIQSEDTPPGTDPQEDELLYIDPNNQFFLNVVEDRLTTLRDSRLNDTTMVYPVETTKKYNVYNSTHTLIGQMTLNYDVSGIHGSEGSLTFTAASHIPSPWEIYNIGTGYGPEPLRPEINVELECYAGGKWYDGYFDATLSQDGTSFDNGTFEYWGYDYNDFSGLSGQLTATNVVNGKINLNPIFGSTRHYPDPVNPRDLLPLFNKENIPIADTFGHGLGNDATLGGIFPGMKQQDWTTLFDLASAPPDPLPDLVGESVSSTLPVPSVPGDKGKVSIVIGNWSNHAASGKINIDIYASLHSIDQPLDSNDIKLVTLANQSVNIARYSAKTYTASVQIPPNIEPNDYYILADIDSTNTIPESDEENNLAVSDNTYETVWKFGSFDDRKNVKLIVNDSNETPVLVTFALTGGGYGEIIGGPDFNEVTLNNTKKTSSLTITTTGKGTQTSVGDIIVNDPNGLKDIIARTTDLRGDITVDGSLGALTLDDVAGTHTITIGPSSNPKAKVNMTFDRVSDLAIDSDTPIKTITATEWLDTDDTPDEISVPSLDTLNIKGDKKRAIGGDFAGTLTVTNNAGSLKIAGTLSNPLTIGGNVNSVTLNQLQGNLTIAGNAKTIKVNQTLHTSPPLSGTYYTLHIGGAASVQYVQAGKRKTIKITAGDDLYAY
jgi:hypothetical protein